MTTVAGMINQEMVEKDAYREASEFLTLLGMQTHKQGHGKEIH